MDKHITQHPQYVHTVHLDSGLGWAVLIHSESQTSTNSEIHCAESCAAIHKNHIWILTINLCPERVYCNCTFEYYFLYSKRGHISSGKITWENFNMRRLSYLTNRLSRKICLIRAKFRAEIEPRIWSYHFI